MLVVEPQGSHQVVALEVDNNIIKTLVPSDHHLKPGENISFDFDMRHLHFFDKNTEKRIQ